MYTLYAQFKNNDITFLYFHGNKYLIFAIYFVGSIAKSPFVYDPTATTEYTPTTRSNIKIPSKVSTNDAIMEKKRLISEMDRLGPKPVFTATGRNVDNVCPSMVSGMEYIRNARLYKGMAFNLEERQGLGK